MALEQAGSLLQVIADQIARFEVRTGRRAAGVCIAIPPHLDPASVRQSLQRMLSEGRSHPPDFDFIRIGSGSPRVVTVDFELEETG